MNIFPPTVSRPIKRKYPRINGVAFWENVTSSSLEFLRPVNKIATLLCPASGCWGKNHGNLSKIRFQKCQIVLQ